MLHVHLHPFNVVLVSLLLLMTMCCGIPVLDLNSEKMGEMDAAMPKGVCGGMIGDCPTVSFEEEMDSESNRRMLVMQRSYISYNTLKRDYAPCGTPGSSYYNCRAGPANSYNRGCEMITRCARAGD
ncbi:OLC1v1018968C1 [Oldenlandia corymbosa var. corymbosa]|uniref:OLC1v1018968C1 n=1 Tax=Oldenlandia corymbosa var. corymbosa TaxID=529605 RepID=A0AAV1EDA2_OLDCO|nr:OLC1v1018968C1 [Oldenlandia corymbosa var. corymbosa]